MGRRKRERMSEGKKNIIGMLLGSMTSKVQCSYVHQEKN